MKLFFSIFLEFVFQEKRERERERERERKSRGKSFLVKIFLKHLKIRKCETNPIDTNLWFQLSFLKKRKKIGKMFKRQKGKI